MPLPIVLTGEAIVPALLSWPLTSSTKMAFAIVPSMPSQLASTKPRSGLSVVPPSLHSQPPAGGGGPMFVTCVNVPFAYCRCTNPESHVHEHATAPASPPPEAGVQFVVALGIVWQGAGPSTQ